MDLRLGFLFCSHKGAVAVRQPYIRVVGMEETNEASSRGPATFTQEEVLTERRKGSSLFLFSSFVCDSEGS